MALEGEEPLAWCIETQCKTYCCDPLLAMLLTMGEIQKILFCPGLIHEGMAAIPSLWPAYSFLSSSGV